MSELSKTYRPRISTIDWVRGLIMVTMALDHTRDFFHTDAFVFDPTDLTKTHTMLFFTRWITHFCMPGFVLLSGISMRLNSFRQSKKELSWFLLTRGLWMVLLEFTVMRFGYFFNFYFDVTILSVLWLFGMCMIIMAALIHLSARTILITSMVILVLHDASGLVPFDATSPWFGAWTIFMRVGFLSVTPSFALIVSYPIIPWLGVMLLGYCIGGWYHQQRTSEERQRKLIITGLTFVGLFILLRFLNLYGDIPWASQKDTWFTILSFLNTTKYPVSLIFTLMTLGPLLIVLGVLEKRPSLPIPAVQVFGRVPLFYFILHFYLIHAAALVVHLIRTGKSWSEIDLHFAKSFGGITPEGGVSLGWTYVAWVAVVLAMYPLCAWYNRYKSSHTQRWLSYL